METTEAVRWVNGTIQGLGDVQNGLPNSSALDITEDGSVIVGVGFGQAFRWSDGMMVGLGNLPGGSNSKATAVSADGSVIVGNGWNTGDSSTAVPTAVRWINNGMIPLTGFPKKISAEVTGVSADGKVIVGWLNGGPQGLRGFRWESDVLLELPSSSFVWGISGDGRTIVGQSSGGAFVWDQTNGVRDLDEILEEEFGLYLGSWHLYDALASSFDGLTLAGTAIRASDNSSRGFVARIGFANLSDGDGDGVPDSMDVCEGTIPNILTDPAGCPPRLPLDWDRDGDVDLRDFAAIQSCMSGPDEALDAACYPSP